VAEGFAVFPPARTEDDPGSEVREGAVGALKPAIRELDERERAEQSHANARLLGRGAVVVECLFAGFTRLAGSERIGRAFRAD
jgi:hypothetical protein